MKKNGCLILDIEGLELSAEDRELLQHPAVAGVILFSRNFYDIQQLCALTTQIRKILPNAIIAVDQEGGRVQRFREGFSSFPTMRSWGESFQKDPEKTKQDLAASIYKLNSEIKAVGVNLNFIPVLDVDHGLSEVIGERSFHRDPNIIVELSRVVIATLHDLNMPAIGKHFPGHGGVTVDSHFGLPIDERTLDELLLADLRPFSALAKDLDMVMTAHIIFPKCDALPVTFSPYWLQEILRKQLGFNGVIISDDLSMAGAEKIGDYSARALAALEAGIDLLLVCNNRPGAIAAVETLERWQLSESQLKRLGSFYNSTMLQPSEL